MYVNIRNSTVNRVSFSAAAHVYALTCIICHFLQRYVADVFSYVYNIYYDWCLINIRVSAEMYIFGLSIYHNLHNPRLK